MAYVPSILGCVSPLYVISQRPRGKVARPIRGEVWWWLLRHVGGSIDLGLKLTNFAIMFLHCGARVIKLLQAP